MHLYVDIGDASSSLRGSTSSLLIVVTWQRPPQHSPVVRLSPRMAGVRHEGHLQREAQAQDPKGLCLCRPQEVQGPHPQEHQDLPVGLSR